MGKIRSVKFNFIMNSLLTASSIVFPLITFPYVSRILQPEGTGNVSFATSVISYFAMFAQLGIPTYGIKVCSKYREDKLKLSRTVHELLAINVITTVLAYVALFAALHFVPQFARERTLFIVMGISLFFSMLGVEWLYKALEQYAYITVRSLIFKIIAIIAMFLMVRSPSDYVIYGFISILASVGSNLFNFINLRKLVYFKALGDYNLKQHFGPISVFFGMAVATTIYTHIDSVMLGIMVSAEQVGYYNAAVKIKTLLVSFVATLGTVLLPRVSYYYQNGFEKEFFEVCRKSVNFVLILAASLMVYFMLYASDTIFFLAGEDYEMAIKPMVVIMPTLLLIGITNVTGLQILVPMGKEMAVLASEIAGAVVNVVINSLMIPSYGAYGAAVGTLAAETAVLVVQVVALGEKRRNFFIGIQYCKIVIALIVAMATYPLINMCTIYGFGKIMISGCIFYIVYIFVLNITKEKMTLTIEKQILEAVKMKLNSMPEKR